MKNLDNICKEVTIKNKIGWSNIGEYYKCNITNKECHIYKQYNICKILYDRKK